MAVFSLYLYMVEGTTELSRSSSIRTLIPFMGALSSRPNHLSKAPPSNTIALGDFNICVLGRQKHSVYSTGGVFLSSECCLKALKEDTCGQRHGVIVFLCIYYVPYKHDLTVTLPTIICHYDFYFTDKETEAQTG